MTYEEKYRAKIKAGEGASLTPELIHLDEGEDLIGTLVAMVPVASGGGKGTYVQYVLDTDKGRVAIHLGSATDAKLTGTVQTGDDLYILYKGKTKTAGGNNVNDWEIRKL